MLPKTESFIYKDKNMFLFFFSFCFTNPPSQNRTSRIVLAFSATAARPIPKRKIQTRKPDFSATYQEAATYSPWSRGAGFLASIFLGRRLFKKKRQQKLHTSRTAIFTTKRTGRQSTRLACLNSTISARKAPQPINAAWGHEWPHSRNFSEIQI